VPKFSTARLLVPLLSAAACTACGDLARIVTHGRSAIDDARLFPSRALHASPAPFRFRDETGTAPLPDEVALEGLHARLTRVLEENDSVAFLVARGDALLFERYFRDFERGTPSLVFSVTKSLTSLLVGCAEQDGLVSVGQAVTDFVPELEPRGFDGVTIEHLLQMTSGSDYRHSDFLWGDNPWFYYGNDLQARLLRLRVARPPGTAFAYKNGDTELLGLALSRAIAPRTLTGYLQERV